MILPGSDVAAIAQAAQALRAGELVGIPTETVYGLAADADNEAAVAQIFAAKGRPTDHPLIVHVASSAQVARYAAQVPYFAQRLIDAFWPGPLTLILPRRPGVAAAAAGGQDSIGLRCPSHPVAQALLRACGLGLAAPSANRFGRVSPTTAAHVQAELGSALLVLDGGPCPVGIESTLVDCTRGAPVVLRPGQITREQLQAACGRSVGQPAEPDAAAPRASGTLESHYAPQARVRLMQADELAQRMQALGTLANNLALWSREPPPQLGAGVLWRAQPPRAQDAARELFATLRELDLHGVQQIWVELPPETPDWEGVCDRLKRAAA
ncbi:MAG: Threonylcarbamoyl-AMP synthase [Pseudomonadota bacterium]